MPQLWIPPRCFNVSLSDWLGNVLSFEKMVFTTENIEFSKRKQLCRREINFETRITKSGNVAFYNLFVQMNEVDLHAEYTRKFQF